ncbi:MAG: J domain-containing protein, partial [Pseudomonadota bacterium]
MRDYYSVLGVERWADAQAIKLAHRNLMRSLHPDSGAATPESVRRVKEINEAYNVLRDPRSKRAYDEGLSHNRNHVIAQYSRARRGSTAVTVASVVVISVSLVAIALVVNGLYPPDRKAASVATANDLSGPSPSNGPERRLARIGNLAKGPKTDPSAGVAGPALSNPNFAPLDTVPHENELGSTRQHFEWPKAPSRPSAHSAS